MFLYVTRCGVTARDHVSNMSYMFYMLHFYILHPYNLLRMGRLQRAVSFIQWYTNTLISCSVYVSMYGTMTGGCNIPSYTVDTELATVMVELFAIST